MDQHALPVLLGATPDAYALAATFYEDFGLRAAVMDEKVAPLFSLSRCCEAYPVPYLTDPRIFLRALSDLYERTEARLPILIPMTDAFAALVDGAEEPLSRRYLLTGGYRVPDVFRDDAPICDPDALLFCYVGREGERRLTYAEVVGKGKGGVPLAVATHPTPAELVELLAPLSLPRGFFTLALRQEADGELLIAPLSSRVSCLRFPLAADHSLPEYILKNYILCTELPEKTPTPEGLFLTVGAGRVRLCQGEKARVSALRRARLVVRSYSASLEGFSPRTRRAYRRLLRSRLAGEQG